MSNVSHVSVDIQTYNDIVLIHGYRFDRMAFHEIVYDCQDRYIGQQQADVLSDDFRAPDIQWVAPAFLGSEIQPS